jgi:hypothetical protein
MNDLGELEKSLNDMDLLTSEENLRDDAMGSVPEEGLLDQSSSKEDTDKTGNTTDKADARKPRPAPKSRKVPNLLSGPALIPGPVTPNFTPACAPDFADMFGKNQMGIFPQFMLATNHILEDAEESESRLNFVLEAMEKAVGLPPLLIDPDFLRQEQNRDSRYRRDRYRQTRPQRPTPDQPQKTFKSSETNFPSLDGSKEQTAMDISTPSPGRKKWTKFPSKNCQIKKMSLTSL